jgi:hypothetical protein
MDRQVVGLFDDIRDAEATVRDLRDIGVNNTDISFVANNTHGYYDDTGERIDRSTTVDTSEAAEGAGYGATGGAVLGGLTGALIGLGALAIPGVGPIIAAGPFAAALGTTGAAVGLGAAGAGIGAAAGGLVGGLVGAGVPEEDAHVYAEGVRRGGALVMARVDESRLDATLDVMDRHNVVNIDERGGTYRSEGWTRFDEAAEPYDLSTRRAFARERSVGVTPRTTRTTRHYDYRG